MNWNSEQIDDWGSPISDGRRGAKKRKLDDSEWSNMSPDCPKLYKHEDSEIMRPIYEFIKNSNEAFLDLLFEFMPEMQLRKQVNQVSLEWCRIAYKVLRRRIGNKVFSIMYCSSLSSGGDISLNQFFHPSLLCLNPSRVSVAACLDVDELMFEDLRLDNDSQNCIDLRTADDHDKPVGYIERLKNPAEIQGIISFGSMEMEAELIDCDDAGEIPQVDVFVYVLSQAIFFTSPDLQKVGDNFVGFSKKRQKIGGKYLSSFLFPRSSHFAIDSFTFGYGNKKWSLEEKYGKSMFDHTLQTKAIIVFKLFEDPNMDFWINDILNKSFNRGSMLVSVISGVYAFVGTSLVKPKTSVSAVGISFMGDCRTSVISVEIDLSSNNRDIVNLKFDEMSFFINGGGSPIGTEIFFALMFCFFNDGIVPESKEVFGPMNEIMNMFQERFPFVPVQTISSISELQHQRVVPFWKDVLSSNFGMDGLTTDFVLNCPLNSNSTSNPNSSTKNSKKVVVLLVKYPLEDKVSK